MRLPSLTVIAAVAMGLGVCPVVVAQYRADQPPVVDLPPVPSTPEVPDVATEFDARYGAAGAPRILLFWNAELSRQSGPEWVVRDHAQTSASRSVTALQESSAGAANSSRLNENSEQSKGQRTREISVYERTDPQRNANLSARNGAQLQRAFESRMRDGGALIVDHAIALRLTALESNDAAHSRKIEAAALRSKAALLLQVLLLPDNQAPLGHGFDVTVREVEGGVVLTSFYSRATPPPPPTRTIFVAGERGFEKQTQTLGSVGVADVAIALANELMSRLGPALAAGNASKSTSRRESARNR